MNRQQFTTWILDTLREAAWAPLGVFGFYLLGRSLQLFKLYPPLDIPTHFVGGVVITYFYRVAIRRSQNLIGEIPFPIQVLLALTSAGTTTIFWEFYENIMDFFFATQMVRGVEDTVVDFLAGLLGALALSLFYKRR